MQPPQTDSLRHILRKTSEGTSLPGQGSWRAVDCQSAQDLRGCVFARARILAGSHRRLTVSAHPAEDHRGWVLAKGKDPLLNATAD